MRNKFIPVVALSMVYLAGGVSQAPADQYSAPPPPKGDHPEGFTDTPMLPSGKWHVHDPARPKPPIVTPGATFSDGAPPPSDAIVLFDGHDLSHWLSDKNGEPTWPVRDGYVATAPHAGYIHTKEEFGDCQLHLEWAEPSPVHGISQGRGNSGVFFQGLYEVQVLDNYDNPTYADGACGALYGQTPPLVNACKKPDEWQTYDIIFEAPRVDADGKVIRPASATVIQNGIVLHHKQAYLGPTGWRFLAHYKDNTPTRGPIALQDHGNPVRFRNIWIRNIEEDEKP
jgi:hypothetical protein